MNLTKVHYYCYEYPPLSKVPSYRQPSTVHFAWESAGHLDAVGWSILGQAPRHILNGYAL